MNFTAGLSKVRTSPDHGVAYDIAGKGVADASSIRNAIYMTLDIIRSREIYSEIAANPLKAISVDDERENRSHRSGGQSRREFQKRGDRNERGGSEMRSHQSSPRRRLNNSD